MFAQSHHATKGFLNKSFPYYDDMCYVFSKDWVARARSETFVDVKFNVSCGFDGVPLDDSHDLEIPMVSS